MSDHMEPEHDLSFLVRRVEKLELQNRRIRTACLVVLLVPIAVLVACASYVSSVVEARKFILRDENGKARVEIAMTSGNPHIRLLDEDGNAHTDIGEGFLEASNGGKGASIDEGLVSVWGDKGDAALVGNLLQFDTKDGTAASLGDDTGTGGNLSLFGKVKAGHNFLDGNTPVLVLRPR